MKSIDAATLKSMLISGANNLHNHYPEIDQLNVFPVPDGDTGLNMNLTLTSGSKNIENMPAHDVYEIAQNFSKGLLTSARGNSGAITSQIFRGFAQALQGLRVIKVEDLSKALVNGSAVAYKATNKPVEGTILTVIRESSASLAEYVKPNTSIEDAMEYLLSEAKASLQRTPDLLPVLKEVGVVDSGGAGLVEIFFGMLSAVKADFIERSNDVNTPLAQSPNIPLYAGAQLTEDEEGYGYCTQFLLRLPKEEERGEKKPFIEKNFTKFLQTHGKSLVLIRDEELVRVHVHTLTPGIMLNYAQNFGEFVTITIENMSEEHENISHGRTATEYAVDSHSKQEEEIDESEPLKELALIVVSSGAGLDEMFTELGADVIVTGGQTMNPSTEDFINAIHKAHAKKIIILPNNSNIVMAASQACEIIDEKGISGCVVPTKTIPQGLSAAMYFDPEGKYREVVSQMRSALKTVKSGSITYAIRDTDISGIHITKGHYLAMSDKKIISCEEDKKDTLFDLCHALIKKSSGLLTVLAGEDIKEEELEPLEEELAQLYPDIEVEVKSGGQPVYSFLIGVE